MKHRRIAITATGFVLAVSWVALATSAIGTADGTPRPAEAGNRTYVEPSAQPPPDGDYFGYVRALALQDSAVAVDFISLRDGIVDNIQAEQLVDAGALGEVGYFNPTASPFRIRLGARRHRCGAERRRHRRRRRSGWRRSGIRSRSHLTDVVGTMRSHAQRLASDASRCPGRRPAGCPARTVTVVVAVVPNQVAVIVADDWAATAVVENVNVQWRSGYRALNCSTTAWGMRPRDGT